MKMKVAFFHIACIGNYRNIVAELLTEIVASGLDTAMSQWNIFVCGGSKNDTTFIAALFAEHSFAGEFKITQCPGDYEFPTLDNLYVHCQQNPEDVVLYFHTKGASRANVNNKYWRKAMSQYILRNWQDCLAYLEEYECGRL